MTKDQIPMTNKFSTRGLVIGAWSLVILSSFDISQCEWQLGSHKKIRPAPVMTARAGQMKIRAMTLERIKSRLAVFAIAGADFS
jgi:hypothetical protein